VDSWDDSLAGVSTPLSFFDKSKVIQWDSYARTWIVEKRQGVKALQKARNLMGTRVSFRLTPWLPTGYNCVQMANEVLMEAGI
jgi:hypothetical protein